MSGTITTAGKTSIINNGTISGAITAGGGKGDKGTTITNSSGSITGGIKAGTGDLTIENYAEISGSGKKIETAANGNLTINNHAGDIKAEIDAETAVATSVKITNYAGATISGEVKLKSADQKSATLDNRGKITGAVTATGENVSISNAGIINSTVTVTGTAKKTNTLNNSGHIAKVSHTEGILSLTNTGKGIIDEIATTQDKVINVVGSYAVDISSDRTKADGSEWKYETDNAINVTGNGQVNFETGSAGAAFRAAGNNGPAFIITDMDIGKQYDLKSFIKGQDKTNMKTTDQIAQNIGFTNSLYGASFDSNGMMTISVEANKSIGALGAIQSIANMNSQMTRAQSIIDGVFDAVATGEIGNLSYPREGAISTQYTGASKKSKLEELAEAVESEKDPKVKEEKLALLLAEKERANKSWIGFATPYFSTSSIAATGFAATNGSAMGFVGGAAKALDNGVLFGAHIGVESQNAGKVGAEMQSLGSSFMAGVHTKMPLGQVNKASLSLVPFVKLQANAMLAANSYRLTPLMDTTREATGLVSGFSASALFGLDMPTNFGYITPEIGLMQQAVIMPELTFNSFNTTANNQTIKGTTATPLYLLAQVRYTKAIKLEKMSLFPTIKAGIRYAMAGNSFVSSINVQNGLFYATNNIDSFVGVLEAGLGAKLGQNTAINLSYGGEFGAQVKTHNINVRVGWQF
ncbi:autotransporter outer membrane beta-barrel domain-containing protein [Helicobacter bilis]|uniref:autotransporter outer membrane beta-barrel domain-containing protein n=1 Tax=Helicobacter bilis TaxID=37372 RepID=UPI000CF02A33|nr:autotransporter outer membrane beta-barrel domain-containing protein [Helicobacter bilis]